MARSVSFRNSNLFALVDDEDYDLVMDSPTQWRVILVGRTDGVRRHYAQRNHVTRKGLILTRLPHIMMHRLILNAPQGVVIDHINGDGLDNRRSNLRLTDASGNQANRQFKLPGASSRFKGVTWNRSAGKWQAAIKVQGRSLHLGLFETEWDAAQAYDCAAREYFGDLAFVNGVAA